MLDASGLPTAEEPADKQSWSMPINSPFTGPAFLTAAFVNPWLGPYKAAATRLNVSLRLVPTVLSTVI